MYNITCDLSMYDGIVHSTSVYTEWYALFGMMIRYLLYYIPIVILLLFL